jgi:hypothetical protein
MAMKLRRALTALGTVIGCGLLMAPVCGGGGDDDGTGATRWWRTCGDPVCRGYTPDPQTPDCEASQVEGQACGTAGTRCDLVDDGCNEDLLCATDDPTLEGCPISRARHKRDITYLDDAARDRYAAQLRGLRLATYRYRSAGPGPADQLGFLIDDVGDGVLVNRGGETVNLYAYTSMAVATIQAQAAQLDALTQQVEELRREVQALRAERQPSPR